MGAVGSDGYRRIAVNPAGRAPDVEYQVAVNGESRRPRPDNP